MIANLHVAALAVSLAGAALMLAWRFRESRAPVSLAGIVAPPVAIALLFILSFGMVVRWRAGMLRGYRRLMREPA
jgi:membrane protein CcdC involved in cytochrome C biogenesis